MDVACLQEVVVRSRVGLLRALAPRFGHVAHRPFAFGVLGGLVILSRWPIAAQRYVVYRQLGRWWNLGWTDRVIRKGILVTELDVDGRRVMVVNTHLAANYGGDWSEGNDYARVEHAELTQLAEIVSGVDASLPLVVAGDLNVPSETWLFADLIGRSSLRDAFHGGGRPTWRPAMEGETPNDIDHVLVRGPIEVVEAEHRFVAPVELAGGRRVPLSDHLGIAVTLRLGPQST